MWQAPNVIGESTSGLWQPPAEGTGLARPSKGKAPARQEGNRHFTIRDHNGDDVRLIWRTNNWEDDSYGRPQDMAPFPFQVYLTAAARGLLQDLDGFAESLLGFIGPIGASAEHLQDADALPLAHYRLDIYTRPCPNVLSCVSHQRLEDAHRGPQNVWPSTLGHWFIQYGDDRYEGKIMVIDSLDWAKNGIVLVEFDPEPAADDNNVVPNGNILVVRATRYRDRRLVQDVLTRWWEIADSTHMEALLRRANAAMRPAVSYPAMDPEAHYDAENQSPVQPDPVEAAVEAADAAWVAGLDALQPAPPDELFQPSEEFDQLIEASYTDNFGSNVTSVWNPALSASRPPFSVVLYLTFNLPPFAEKALFSCLNTDLLANEPWTLDVIRNMPSLADAFDYHARLSVRRTASASERRATCIEMLVRKVAQGRLPRELCEQIETFLLPPPLPDYFCRPTRAYHNVFLYMQENEQAKGPLIIYSNPEVPVSMQSDNTSSSHEDKFLSKVEFGVAQLNSWKRVSWEIHTLWSFCAPPRSSIASGTEIPRVVISLRLPRKIRQGGSLAIPMRNSEVRLRSSRPVMVPPVSPISHIGLEMFIITDLDTGLSLPAEVEGHDTSRNNVGFDNWAAYTSEEPTSPRLMMLVPGINDIHWVDASRWGSNYPLPDFLVPGHRYSLGLRTDVVVRRWCYGTEEQPGVPNQLPPIPVVLSEDSQTTFLCTDSSD